VGNLHPDVKIFNPQVHLLTLQEVEDNYGVRLDLPSHVCFLSPDVLLTILNNVAAGVFILPRVAAIPCLECASGECSICALSLEGRQALAETFLPKLKSGEYNPIIPAFIKALGSLLNMQLELLPDLATRA
jgi:hypothetical protein